MTNPDAPLSLVEVMSAKTSTSIGISWTQGLANGGASVIDYTISYQSIGSYSVLQSGVVATTFTATGLTTGTTYSFVIQARNSFGISVYSTSISILCAYIPSIPVSPTTSVVGSNVIVTWTAPNN